MFKTSASRLGVRFFLFTAISISGFGATLNKIADHFIDSYHLGNVFIFTKKVIDP